MKIRFLGTAFALAAMSSAPLLAATQTGNLNVTTTIQVSCDAPSPSGTLNLPFNAASALNQQANANTAVTVTVTCYGNPTVNHVDFDSGIHRSAAAVVEEAGVRYMLRSGGTASDAKSYLGYKLYATDIMAFTSADMSDNELMGTGSDNRLTFGVNYTGQFKISGRVFESTTRTGAFGDATLAASGGAVPGGTYNDIVVMTVDYN